MSIFLSENNPVKVVIGSRTFTNVVSVAIKPQGVGGGDMVTSQTVANVHNGVSFTYHAKEILTVVTIDAEDVLQYLLSSGYINLSGENMGVSPFTVTYRNSISQQQTVTLNGNLCKVKSCEIKLVQKDNPVTEIEILTHGELTFSGWQ
jgi:hypothetical protein